MAVYQLGALVTKIKGSIGGTTFKTQRTTNVVMRKSYGYGRSKLLSNAALQYARYIFTKWSFLTPEEQSSWQNTAALVFFPDKFGNQIHITGRQLFTKVNINLQKENYYASVPEGFTMNVPVLDVENALLNPVAKYASLGVEFFDNATGYVIISAEVSINNLQSAVFSRRFALTRSLTTGGALIEFGTEFFERFPYVTSAYNVRMYVEAMNIYGIKGLPQAVPVNFINIIPVFNPGSYVTLVDWSSFVNLNSNLPQFHIIDMWYQSDTVAMPEPDFDAALPLPAQGISNIDTVTLSVDWILLPAGLRYGNYLRLWLKPRDYNGTVFEPVSVIWGAKPEPLYMFNPFAITVNPDYSLSATLENNFPAGTVIRVTIQNGGGSFPNPTLLYSTVAGDYALGVGGLIEIPSLLDNPAIDIEIGDYIVVLFQPYLDGFPIDTGLPLEVVYSVPVASNGITTATFIVTPSVGGPVDYAVFNNYLPVPITTGDSFTAYIYFSSWQLGDPVPDAEQVLLDILGLGQVGLTILTFFVEWQEAEKRLYYNTPSVSSDINYTLRIPSQEVPVLP